MEEQKNFGSHVMIDGYGGDQAKLDDVSLILSFLRELPRKLQMRALADPIVMRVPKISEKDPGGISGFVIIAESHISVHTFPDRGYLTADVYSCKTEMDKGKIGQYFIETFKLDKDIELQYVTRGTQFYKRAPLA